MSISVSNADDAGKADRVVTEEDGDEREKRLKEFKKQKPRFLKSRTVASKEKALQKKQKSAHRSAASQAAAKKLRKAKLQELRAQKPKPVLNKKISRSKRKKPRNKGPLSGQGVPLLADALRGRPRYSDDDDDDDDNKEGGGTRGLSPGSGAVASHGDRDSSKNVGKKVPSSDAPRQGDNGGKTRGVRLEVDDPDGGDPDDSSDDDGSSSSSGGGGSDIVDAAAGRAGRSVLPSSEDSSEAPAEPAADARSVESSQQELSEPQQERFVAEPEADSGPVPRSFLRRVFGGFLNGRSRLREYRRLKPKILGKDKTKVLRKRRARRTNAAAAPAVLRGAGVRPDPDLRLKTESDSSKSKKRRINDVRKRLQRSRSYSWKLAYERKKTTLMKNKRSRNLRSISTFTQDLKEVDRMEPDEENSGSLVLTPRNRGCRSPCRSLSENNFVPIRLTDFSPNRRVSATGPVRSYLSRIPKRSARRIKSDEGPKISESMPGIPQVEPSSKFKRERESESRAGLHKKRRTMSHRWHKGRLPARKAQKDKSRSLRQTQSASEHSHVTPDTTRFSASVEPDDNVYDTAIDAVDCQDHENYYSADDRLSAED